MNEKIRYDNAYSFDGLKYNFFSVEHLNSLGYPIEFENYKGKIYDATGELIRSGEKTRGILFYLDLYEDTCLFAQFEDIWLWHKRLCHVNFDNLVNISKMKKNKRITKIEKT